MGNECMHERWKITVGGGGGGGDGSVEMTRERNRTSVKGHMSARGLAESGKAQQ